MIIRAARGAQLLIGAVLGGAAAALVLLVLALNRGPLPLPALKAPMTRLVEAGFSDAQAQIGRVEAVLFEDGRLAPGLTLRDAVLRDAAGRRLFAAPRMRAQIDLRALLRGRVRPSLVAITGASATVRRSDGGGLQIALGGAATSAAPAGGAGLSEDFSGRIVLEDARLALIDETHATRLDLADARVEAVIGGADATAEIVAAVRQGDAPPARLSASVTVARETGVALSGKLRGARTRQVATLLRELTPLADIDARFDLDLDARIGADGGPETARLTLRSDGGVIRMADGALAFDRAETELAYDRADDRVRIGHAEISGPMGAARARGFLDLSRDAAGAVSGAAAELTATRLALDAPSLFPEPVAFDGAHLVTRLRRDRSVVEIATATLRRGALALNARGRLEAVEGGWSGEIDLTGRGATAEDIRALWPLGVAPGARDWVRAHLEEGHVPRFDLTARVGPDAEGVALSFVFEDGRADYLPPMPPIEDGAGWGVVDMRRFGLMLTRGAAQPADAGRVSLAGSSILLPDLDDPMSWSTLALRGAGPLDGFLAALDSEPLGFVGKIGLDPRSVTGEATARAALTLPLLKDLKLEQVAVETTASLRDVALFLPALRRNIAAGRLALTADASRLSLSGPLTLDGVPMEVAATEVFAPAPGETRRRADVAMRLTAARAAEFGLDISDRFDGAASMQAEIVEAEGGGQRVSAELNLRGAGLRAPELDWRKPRDAAGSLSVTARLEDNATRLERFDLRAPGLSLSGAARLGAGGDVRTLSLTRFRLRDEADLALELARAEDGWRATLRGAHLDAALAQHLSEGEGSGAGEAIRFDAALDRLSFGARALTALTAQGALDAALRGRASAQARLGGARLDLRYDATGAEAPRIIAKTDDLGAALRGADLYADAYGGAFKASGRLSAQGALPLTGEATASGVRIARESDLAARVAAAAPAEAARLLREEGVRIDKARVDFTLTDDALSLSEGRANGPSIGLTIAGRYLRKAERLEFSGVFTPAYGLNSAIGAIPILGTLLTGGEGRGVFAFNYRIEGPASDPKLVFSPLSGLAPGVLRKLFQP